MWSSNRKLMKQKRKIRNQRTVWLPDMGSNHELDGFLEVLQLIDSKKSLKSSKASKVEYRHKIGTTQPP